MICNVFETISKGVEQANTEATWPRLLLSSFFPLVCYGFGFFVHIVTFLQMSNQVSSSLTREAAWDSLSTWMGIVCAQMLLAGVRDPTEGTLDTTLGLTYRTAKHADIGINMFLLMLPPIWGIFIGAPIFANCTPIEVGCVSCFRWNGGPVKCRLHVSRGRIRSALIGAFGSNELGRCSTGRSVQISSPLSWWRGACETRLLEAITLRGCANFRVAY